MDAMLLVVEDDLSLREVIRLGLEGEGFRVSVAEDGPSALIAFASSPPDLVLLDVMLPGLDGFSVCRELRKISLAPIIMLTARASTADVVEGLEAGADDYVTKPFEFQELTARIRSALRRSAVRVSTTPGSSASGEGTRAGSGAAGLGVGLEPAAPTGSGATSPDPGSSTAAPGSLTLGPLVVDPGAHSVRRRDQEVFLTVTEFRLLYELVRHVGQVLTRDQLLELVWGYSYLGDSRLVDVHVQRLRAKIEDDPSRPVLVVTVRGVGYRADRHEGQ